MNSRKEFIEKIVLEAGDLIRQRITEDMEVNEKDNNRSDLVTNVDFEVERFLVEKISKEFPEDSFLTEEKTVSLEDADNVWIIDPIDGTMNFIYALRDFAISIAPYVKGVGMLGVVYDVMADELVIAQKDKGATLNGKKLNKVKPESLKQSIVDISLRTIRNSKIKGIADFSDLPVEVLSHRNLGSAAIRITHIGLNRVHAYVSDRLSIWDIAAGIIILEELGGTHNFINKDLIYNSDSFYFMGVNNTDVYKEIKDKFFIK